jgi:hypothetical protein
MAFHWTKWEDACAVMLVDVLYNKKNKFVEAVWSYRSFFNFFVISWYRQSVVTSVAASVACSTFAWWRRRWSLQHRLVERAVSPSLTVAHHFDLNSIVGEESSEICRCVGCGRDGSRPADLICVRVGRVVQPMLSAGWLMKLRSDLSTGPRPCGERRSVRALRPSPDTVLKRYQ